MKKSRFDIDSMIANDVVIVGGGLAGSLLAFRLKTARPDLRFHLFERGASLGGSHTWSFHEKDVSPAAWTWLRPLVSKSWNIQEVRFPGHCRTLHARYHSIRSLDFHDKMMPVIGSDVSFGSEADTASFAASCVIDARGFETSGWRRVAYQKFLGLDLELELPHGLPGPCIMDATCAQRDGYRFFYVLPWTDRALLVEDTRYSDSPNVNREEYAAEILKYAAAQGWKVRATPREEVGVLPIPLDEPEVGSASSAVPIGVRAGLFHDTTGYSLPDAVRMAHGLSQLTPLSGANARDWLTGYRAQGKSRRAFYRLLNRMMFLGARPEQRYRILERFYRLPQGVITRFYAGQTSWLDAARILTGKPPIPLLSAVRSLREVTVG